MKTPLNLVIVGAGALTESVYLPVLKNSSCFKVTALVDTNVSQAARLAELYQIPHVLSDVQALTPSQADAALIVLPNFLHASVALMLLDKGIPVLVEKPMANTSEDCKQLIEKAKQVNKSLAVGLVRRFYPTTEFIKNAVQHNFFGKLQHFDFEEGHVFEWKLQSDYLLSKEKAGGGVLVDTGIHLLDQMIYCIGFPESVDYYDDNQGGVEADCKLLVQLANDVKGTLSFSRIRTLRNTMILTFEHATLEVGLNANSEMQFTFPQQLNITTPVMHKGEVCKNKDAFARQLEDFADSIVHKKACKVTGEQGLLSVQLVEKCYAARKPLLDLQLVF